MEIVKKISPKIKPLLPTAKRNKMGNIVSGPKELKELLAEEYKHRLRLRPVRPDLTTLRTRKNFIFRQKLIIAEAKKTKNWTASDLEKALSDLKNDKSRDSEGLINEIFKEGIIGNNLKTSLLMMFNKMKNENIIPSFLKVANITTVPKSG